MSSETEVDDYENEMESHFERAERDASFRRGDWSENMWESHDCPTYIAPWSIFDAIARASSIHYKKHKYKFESLIITSMQKIYPSYDCEYVVFSGVGRMYLHQLHYPRIRVPEHFESRMPTYLTYCFPIQRYIKVGFTMSYDLREVPDNPGTILDVVGLVFCENGRVISKHVVENNKYNVDLAWV